MPSIRLKYNRIAAVCGVTLGCIYIINRVTRPVVRNPLVENGGVTVPRSLDGLEAPLRDDTTIFYLNTIQGWTTLPIAIFSARQAEKVADVQAANGRLRSGQCAIPLGSGDEDHFCGLVRLVLDWADRDRRILGCTLGMADMYEFSPTKKRVPLFERFGWCSTGNGKPSILSEEACAAEKHASDAFRVLARKAEDYQDVWEEGLRGERPMHQFRVGTVCVQWAAGYAIRLMNTVLTVLHKNTTNLSSSHSHAVLNGLTAVHNILTAKITSAQDTAALFQKMEQILQDSSLLAAIRLSYTDLRQVSKTRRTSRPSVGVSMVDLLRNQRARVSPGPLSLSSTIRLRSGADMPLIGFGTGYGDCFVARDKSVRTWDSDHGIRSSESDWFLETYFANSWACGLPTPSFVASAIADIGIRMVDTAALYGSEQRVFAGVRKAVAAGVPRSQIFVMTKAWPPLMERAGVANELLAGERGVRLPERLEDGQLEYVDLYSEHHAIAKQDRTWKGSDWKRMLQLKSSGYTRSLGVFSQWMPGADIIQERFHPSNARRIGCRFESGVENYMMELLTNNITIVNLGVVLDASRDPMIRYFAAKRGLSPIQYAVRWSLQIGMPVLVMSESLDHLRMDVDVFDFEITNEEMLLIDLQLQCGTADEIDYMPK
eukprot:m.307175 g.307175  ORF g.307175 m.307175 type:complete len:657 (-) comp16359_c0_seq2:24-1994(-)